MHPGNAIAPDALPHARRSLNICSKRFRAHGLAPPPSPDRGMAFLPRGRMHTLHIDMRKKTIPPSPAAADAADMANEAQQQHLANASCRRYKKAALSLAQKNSCQAAAMILPRRALERRARHAIPLRTQEVFPIWHDSSYNESEGCARMRGAKNQPGAHGRRRCRGRPAASLPRRFPILASRSFLGGVTRKNSASQRQPPCLAAH